jgi:hypothetical protein
VEAHAAVAESENLNRVSEIGRQVIEEHVADAPADDDADHRPEGKIPDRAGFERGLVVLPQRLVGEQHIAIGSAEQDAEQVGDAVPVDRERAD